LRSTGPKNPQFPHPFFLTSTTTIFISVSLAQTLLNRNVSVFGAMRANRGNPHDLEGEGKHLKKREVSIPEEW
jgi:hypothetical protein